MNKELGLSFEPQNNKFRDMMKGLQKNIGKNMDKIFFLDASSTCEKIFSTSFMGTSNKLSGWLLREEELDCFIKAYKSKEIEKFKSNRVTLWSYWYGEYEHGWLYSFKGPIFGEKDICAKNDKRDE